MTDNPQVPSGEMVLGLGHFNKYVRRQIDGFVVDMDLANEMLRKKDCLSFAMKRNCMW